MFRVVQSTYNLGQNSLGHPTTPYNVGKIFCIYVLTFWVYSSQNVILVVFLIDMESDNRNYFCLYPKCPNSFDQDFSEAANSYPLELLPT